MLHHDMIGDALIGHTRYHTTRDVMPHETQLYSTIRCDAVLCDTMHMVQNGTKHCDLLRNAVTWCEVGQHSHLFIGSQEYNLLKVQ